MAKIAISYRRSDSQDITGRIFDRLVQHYGKDTVFRDIDSIQPGIDFRTQIAAALGTTDVLLVVLGPAWLGRGKDNTTRIDSEADPVRIEVETALKRDIPIIPILVGGTRMPEVNELPQSLRDFAYRHAVTVDGGRDFDHHMDGLIRSLHRIFHVPQGGKAGATSAAVSPSPRFSPTLYGIVGGLAVAVVVLAVVLLRPSPPQSTVVQQPQGQMSSPATGYPATGSPVGSSPASSSPGSSSPAGSSAVSTPPPPAAAPGDQIHITPTFNCAKADNEDEQTICHNSELIVLDQRLDAVYSSTRGRLDADKRKALAADENVWLAQRRSCKSDVGCIRDAYLKRIKILQAWQ
jgi:uncharacterized protein YecT (DUF1311 family)